MKKLLYFYLKECPHCKRAEEFLEELYAEEPAYREVSIERIEESEQEELAGRYDYYYVPTFFIGDKKLHEGVPTKEAVRAALDAALQVQ